MFIWPRGRDYMLYEVSPFGVAFEGAPAMERRLAAILAADVKGYCHLTELSEEASTATLRMYLGAWLSMYLGAWLSRTRSTSGHFGKINLCRKKL